MNVARVYRLQNANGIGPYHGSRHMGTAHSPDEMLRPPGHLEVWTHGPQCDGNNALYGFGSLDQLNAWFTDYDLDALSSEGFTVHTYTVAYEYIDHGLKQVRFDVRGIQA